MEVGVLNITESSVDDALIVYTPEKMMPNPFYRQGLKARRERL